MPLQFCNVDLDIRSTAPLDAIASYFAGFGDRVFPLFCGEIDAGQYLASFEIHWDVAAYPDDPEGNPTMPEKWGAAEMVSAFCELIRDLQGLALEQWQSATSRAFDLGYEADDDREPFKVSIPDHVLDQIAKVGASLAFTVYPNQKEAARE